MSNRLTEDEIDKAASIARSAQEYMQMAEIFPAWVLSMADEITTLRTALAASQAECEALRGKIEANLIANRILADERDAAMAEAEALRAAWDGVEWWDWGDSFMQDYMIAHGLIEEFDAPANNDCGCDEPEPHRCLRRTALLTGEGRGDE